MLCLPESERQLGQFCHRPEPPFWIAAQARRTSDFSSLDAGTGRAARSGSGALGFALSV